MKLGIIKFCALLGISIGLAGCETVPVKGKVCYETPQGTVCVGSDGKAVVIDGTFKGQK